MAKEFNGPTTPEITPPAAAIFLASESHWSDRISVDPWLVPLRDITPFSSLSQIESALLAVRELIPADADDLTRATMKASVRDALKKTRVTAAMIDAALAKPPKSTRQENHAKKSTATLVRDDDPWPTPVNGAAVLDEVATLVRKLIVMPPASVDAVSLWIAYAGFLEVAQIMPMLAIVAATMRSGKSSLAEIVAALTPRGLLVSNLTPAVLFRLIDICRPTLIADEADTWLSNEKSELRGIFNSGHSRATAKVARCVGDNHDVKVFSTWAPKVIAMIGRPPATIVDRSVLITLKRKRIDEPVERLRHDRLMGSATPIRRRLRRWTNDNLADFRTRDPEVPGSLHDRAADNWRGLLAIADMAGGSWAARARKAAVATSATAADDAEDVKVELLADLQAIFQASGEDMMSSAELIEELLALPDRPWAEWSRGRPLSAAKLARLLKPFGAVPFDAKVDGKTLKRYRRDALTDAWSRYLPQNPQLRNPPKVHKPETETEPQLAATCQASESATGPINIGSSCGVALPDRVREGAFDGVF